MTAFIRQAVQASPDYPFAPIDAPYKLDQNESPEDFPEHLKAQVLARAAALAWNRYSDLHADALCQRIAQYEQWNADGVVAATGSNVLIALLIQLTALQGRVITVKPNFALYGLDAQLLGAGLTEVPLRADFSLDCDAMCRAVSDAMAVAPGASGVIYVPRPHAPTGTLASLEELARLAQSAPDWMLVIDEAYCHFAPDDALGLAHTYSNIVLLRTFSKAWGLAGMRLGYALSSAPVARQLRKLVPPFAVSVVQSVCAQVALENPEYMRERVAHIQSERARMLAALAAHPHWRVTPSHGNFLLIRTPDAAAAFAHLLAQGVLVRRQDSYFGLEGCIRVTVGTARENDAFLRAALSAG